MLNNSQPRNKSPNYNQQPWLKGFDSNFNPIYGSPGPKPIITKMADADLTARIKAGVTAALSTPQFFQTLTDIINTTIDEKLAPLENRITTLEPLVDRVAQLELDLNNLKQELKDEKIKSQKVASLTESGKINNLLVSGIPESIATNDNESDEDPPPIITDNDMINNIAQALNIKIGPFTTSRVGKQKTSILLSFNSVWDKRKFYAARSKLRENGFEGVFLNEDLFKSQAELAFHCRQAKRQELLASTWTTNGSVYVKTLNGGLTMLAQNKDYMK